FASSHHIGLRKPPKNIKKYIKNKKNRVRVRAREKKQKKLSNFMPKEVHQIYDTLKLMEQQEDTKKVEAEAKKEEQSNSTNADNQANTSKKDQLLDISA
ncbi:hypothetical protein ACXD8Y_001704, partial [Campylobacter jejuni]